MTTVIVSQRRIPYLPWAIMTKVRNLLKTDQVYTDYSTHHLFPEATNRNQLWLETQMREGKVDRLIVLCYSGHTALIQTAEDVGVDVTLFKEC